MAKSKKSGQLTQPRHVRRSATTHARIVRYGVKNFTRNAWLTVAATAVMTVTLIIVFVTVLAGTMLNNTVKSLSDKLDISIYFKPETDDDVLRNLAGKMQLVENVTAVETSSSAKEYETYLNNFKDNQDILRTLSDIGGELQLPAVMHVKVRDFDKIDPVKNLVENDSFFKEWIYGRRAPTYGGDKQDQINTISRWADLAQRGGLVVGGVFLLISILVIFNTIRMAIFSRRDEIDMMKSIGADRRFIRGPFLIEAEMYGFFAALLATAAGYVGFMLLSPGMESYGIVIEPIRHALITWAFPIVGGMVALGMLIGYVSARLAVRRYLQP